MRREDRRKESIGLDEFLTLDIETCSSIWLLQKLVPTAVEQWEEALRGDEQTETRNVAFI